MNAPGLNFQQAALDAGLERVFAAGGGTGILHIELTDGRAVPEHCDAGMVVLWCGGRPIGHLLRGSDGQCRHVRPVADSATPHAPGELPSASIVICTRDRPNELRRCLSSLPEQSVPPAEVIVVDNASKGFDTREVALAAGAIYIREDRPGLDIARNRGAERASAAIVAYTDDDVVLHPRWLERLLIGFGDPAVGAVTGLVLPAEIATEAQRHFETYWSFGQGYLRQIFRAADFDAARHVVFPAWKVGAGASMAFRREVFERAGFFDERLDVGQAGCSGDSEFWYRLLANGYDCVYEPSSVAFHFHRRSMEGLSRQIYSYMRGHSAALLVQYERTRITANLKQAFKWTPVWYLGRIRRRLLGRNVAEDRFLWTEVAGYVSGLLFYIRRRHA